MSYSIVFDTKFIKLSDGRLLHLDRSGCNNDTSGRSLDDYTGTIYTEQQLKERAEHFMKNGKSDYWELKIGSKPVTFYEYGEHLLRMAKRAKTFKEFNDERYFYGIRFDGVELLSPEIKVLKPKEFDEYWYNNTGSFRYRRLTTRLETENDIVKALENKEPVGFYVGKKYNRRWSYV